MGQSASKAAGDQGDAVTGRAVGITGGNALKRLTAPKLPQGARKAAPEDYGFIEVSLKEAGTAVLGASCCAGGQLLVVLSESPQASMLGILAVGLARWVLLRYLQDRAGMRCDW